MAKLHYLKFYPESWIAEIGLRMCSLAARGLWIDLICHMAKSPEHGVLLTMGGKPISDAQIASVIGVDPATVASSLAELETNCVLSRREDGAIFSRRMVRDHAEYVRQAAFGSKGGRSNKGGLEATLKGTHEAPLKGPLEATPEACVDSRFLVLGSNSSPEGTEPKQLEPGRASETFEKFWSAYPAEKARARTVCWHDWCVRCFALSADKIMEVLERWKRSEDWKKDGGKFIPKAENYLRDEYYWSKGPTTKGSVRPPNATEVCAWWQSLTAEQKAPIAARGVFTVDQVDGYIRHKSPPDYITEAWKGVARAG